jgi:DNA repair photolyase
MMPVLPFIEDQEENIAAIVARACECGAAYILPWFGMSLRDRQRAYYYDRLDSLFPGVRQKYERHFGERYYCASPNAARLERVFLDLCQQHGIATRIKPYLPEATAQLQLF